MGNPRTLALILVTVGCFGLALFLNLMRGEPTSDTPRTVDVYAYDAQAKKLVPVKPDVLSRLPDGTLAPRAYVLGCGDCEEANRFIAYLERFDEPGWNLLQSARTKPLTPAERKIVAQGHQVRSPESTQWLGFDSADAAKMMKERRSDKMCKDGKKLIRCEPPPPLPPGAKPQPVKPGNK